MRVGILGGSFDPPHLGHLRMAKLAQRALSLDEILFIPCAKQPLKSEGPVADGAHRAAMVALALQRHSNWRLDTREIARGGTSYTVDTLRAVGAERASDDLYYIIGQDGLEALPRWKQARAIPGLATLVVVPRGGAPVVAPHFAAGAKMLRVAELRVSSSDIRRRISRREPWEDLVPAAVATYIRRQGLYGFRRCS